MSERRQLGQVPGLDGLRGVAVLLVVLFHTRALAYPGVGAITTTHGFGWLNNFASGGELGVDIFFVLSGFLITGLLLGEHNRSGGIGMGRFYARRALRLLPALIVLLAVQLLWSFVAPAKAHLTTPHELFTIFTALTYWLNYALIHHRGSLVPELQHLWSLSVEEQFYLVWPVVLLFMLRRRAVVIPAVIIAAIVAVVVNRAYLWNQAAPAVYNRTDARADSLLIGALLAWAWTRGWTPRWNTRIVAWCAAGLMVVMISTTHAHLFLLYDGGFTVFALAAAAVILAVITTDWGAGALRWGPLCTVGKVSYGLYLWHVVIFAAVFEVGHPRWVVSRVVVGYGLTILATWLSWMLVERRALAFRHRLGSERGEALAEARTLGDAG